jgi:chromosome segregation ATPase
MARLRAELQATETDLAKLSQQQQSAQHTLIAAQAQIATAQANQAAIHNALDNGRTAVAQVSTALQTAQDQANAAAGALQNAQAALAATQQQLQKAQEQLDRIGRWNAEIVAEPLDRPALQSTEQELEERTAALEEACDWACIQLEIEQETLAALL